MSNIKKFAFSAVQSRLRKMAKKQENNSTNATVVDVNLQGGNA